MDFLIEVGNTRIGVCFHEDGIFNTFNFPTLKNKKSSYFAKLFTNKLPNKYLLSKMNSCIISSVVPELNNILSKVVYKLFKIKPKFFSFNDLKDMKLKVDNPFEVGNDLIADCYGAKKTYGFPSLIIDLGTASKILAIDKDGDFIGCSIAPGIEISFKSLFKSTSLINSQDINPPKDVIGKNTISCLNSGIIFGHAEMINGMVKRFLNDDELRNYKNIILTGGNALLISPLLNFKHTIDPNLIFEGLLFLSN